MDDDDFHDASDVVVSENEMEADIRTANLAQHLFFQNKFEEARDLVNPSHPNMYHHHAMTGLCTLEAMMTFAPDDFQHAIDVADETLKHSDILSKESLTSRINGNLFDSNRTRHWSDERVHAYLVRAESIVFKTVAGIMSSGTDIFAIAHACLNIRESYKIFEHCEKIAQKRTWKSQLLKDEFSSGAKFGLGVYQLYLSLLPPKILKVLEWVGFKGDRTEGLKLLYEAAETDTARTLFSKWFPMAYHYIFQFQFGTVGERDGMSLVQTNIHLQQTTEMFPNGVLIRFNQGKRCQIEGRIDEAIQYFTPNEIGWTNFHHFCYWDLFWSYGIDGRFAEAAQFADKLYMESVWSPSIYSWLQATVLLASGTEVDIARAVKLFEKTDDLRQRIAGKSIPDEKFAAKKASNYVNGKSKMSFGFLEAAYYFNYLKIGNNNQNIAKYWLQFIRDREGQIESGHEDMGICHVLKANLLSQLGRYIESAAEAQIALKLFPKPKQEPQIAPCAMFELGNSLRLQGKYKEAIKCFDRAKNDYSRYHFEHRLHFRCHTFKQLIESRL